MSVIIRYKLFIVVSAIVFCSLIYLTFFTHNPIDYNTQVKPIINKKCISCHGGVKKKAGFSLLFQEEALATTASGKPAIIPGDAKNSEMIRRLHLSDPEERMPYQADALTKEEIEILTRWVDEGAKFSTHWAYSPVKEPKVPSNGLFSFFKKKAINDIDAFIDEKLNELDLEKSTEADKKTLLRRLSLDLIGMPAPEKIASKFLQDSSEKAYEILVEELLAFKGYGEKWAGMWLDLARYADTKGYERDDARSIWRYRDWLIQSFNEDKPYDKFIIEQIAGDLIENATDQQLIATAFHRNTMTNDEGGTDNEEFRTAAIIDRVNTTWETLMGTSFGCIQCHSHPYDPFKHDEYYKFMAYFNNSRDEDTYEDYPLLKEFRNNSISQFDSVINWLKSNTDLKEQAYFKKFIKTGQPAVNSLLADSMINAALADTKWLLMRKNSFARLNRISLTGKSTILIKYSSGVSNGILNVYLNSANSTPWLKIPINKSNRSWEIKEIKMPPTEGAFNLILHYENKSLKTENDDGMMFDWLAFTRDFPGKGKREEPNYHKLYINLLNNPDAEMTPIMMDNPSDMHRETRVFERGNRLLKTSIVNADYPSIFKLKDESFENNRLGLAKWMTSPTNPLTARTLVNRIWEQLFGQGLVETLEDLGSQGAIPTHQALLDYLSYNFMHEDNWSLKKLLKRIVMTETYKQTSVANKKMLEIDPLNKYYARAPRIRLSAEQIRDQALSISEVLSPKMYGPSVMPFQPEGIWSSPYDDRKWIKSSGEDQYRRALYTYWKRSSPYPSMVNFDGAAREVCLSRRIKTNTPLQALTLLNDSTYWDLSVKFAQKIISKNNVDLNTQIGLAYKKATGKEIDNNIRIILKKLYNQSVDKINNGQVNGNIQKLLSDSSANNGMISLAAMSVVTNAILNLDEVITKNNP
jgi:hypothetical protein